MNTILRLLDGAMSILPFDGKKTVIGLVGSLLMAKLPPEIVAVIPYHEIIDGLFNGLAMIGLAHKPVKAAVDVPVPPRRRRLQ